jgi:putative addiction module component (TIGR02574 family)
MAMSTAADTILGTALALPPDERAWLASELIASLDEGEDADVETAWATEIERRITEVESGEAETSSWEEARGRIRTKLTKS